MKKRKIIIWSIVIIAAITALISVCDIFVSKNASGKTYDDVDSIPHRKVGLTQSLWVCNPQVIRTGVTTIEIETGLTVAVCPDELPRSQRGFAIHASMAGRMP